MSEIRIPDDIYKQVVEAARSQNISVERFVAEAVQVYMQDEPISVEHKFTAPILAHLDRIAAELDAGCQTYSSQEVDEELAANKKSWLENHQR
jgi:hypothetical protein